MVATLGWTLVRRGLLTIGFDAQLPAAGRGFVSGLGFLTVLLMNGLLDEEQHCAAPTTHSPVSQTGRAPSRALACDSRQRPMLRSKAKSNGLTDQRHSDFGLIPGD